MKKQHWQNNRKQPENEKDVEPEESTPKYEKFSIVEPKMTGAKARYLKACADELTNARFGKMKWDKRSKFHKALMERIA